MARSLELAGKVTILPIVVLVFVFTFNDIHIENLGQKATKRIYTVFALAFAGLVFVREFKGYLNSCKSVQQRIRNKIDNPTGHSLSSLEVFYYNYTTFGIWSRSAAHYHRWKKDNDKQYHIEDISNKDKDRRDNRESTSTSRSSQGDGFDSGGGNGNGIQMSGGLDRGGRVRTRSGSNGDRPTQQGNSLPVALPTGRRSLRKLDSMKETSMLDVLGDDSDEEEVVSHSSSRHSQNSSTTILRTTSSNMHQL